MTELESAQVLVARMGEDEALPAMYEHPSIDGNAGYGRICFMNLIVLCAQMSEDTTVKRLRQRSLELFCLEITNN